MSNLAVKRIRRELRQVIESEEVAQCGIKVELTNDSFYELNAEIMGPSDTPYEGGKFELEIKIPSNYPFQPPQIRFVTKIWHANISSVTGFICLDILNNTWSASLTLRTVLLSMQALLSDPEPDDPQDAVVARQFQNYPEMFKLTARHWTNVYAGGPSKNESFNDKVRKMIDLGFCESDDDSLAILSSCNWDLDNAVNQFLPADKQPEDDQRENNQSEDYEGDDYEGDDYEGDDYEGDDYESDDYESGDYESGDYESEDYESDDDQNEEDQAENEDNQDA